MVNLVEQPCSISLAKQENVVKFEVALGYRDSIRGPWKRKVLGNVTRTLTCGYSKSLKVRLFGTPVYRLSS